jgi:ribosome biogenesis protein Nip4
MAVISFGREAEAIWNGAGWAFRQILRDLSPYAQGDAEFERAMKDAEDLGSFIVNYRDATLKGRITRATVRMCDDVLNGMRTSSIMQHHSDPETQELYWKELAVLRFAATATGAGSPAVG